MILDFDFKLAFLQNSSFGFDFINWIRVLLANQEPSVTNGRD